MNGYLVGNCYIEIDFKLYIIFKNETQEGALNHSLLVFWFLKNLCPCEIYDHHKSLRQHKLSGQTGTLWPEASDI